VSCTFEGEDAPGFPTLLEFTNDGVAQTLRAPLGSTCTAEELTDGGATSVAISPEDGIVLDDEESEFAIEVTNTFDVGSFQVLKEVDGAGADLFELEEQEERTFVFEWECVFNGQDPEETGLSGTLTVEYDGSSDEIESDVVDGIPVGATCTITETSNANADETPAAVQIIIDDDPEQVQIAGFLNVFSAGKVSVEKLLDGDAAELERSGEFLVGLEFQVQVLCEIQRGDATVQLFGGIVTLTPGLPVVLTVGEGEDAQEVLLPVGTQCRIVTETVSQGATGEPVFSDPVTVEAQEDPNEVPTLALTVTNTFDLAQFTVSKKVVGPGSGPFTFVAECVYPAYTGALPETGGWDDDEASAPGLPAGWEWVAYPLAPEDAEFTLNHGESRTITVLAGVDCVIAETPVPAGARVTATSIGGVIEKDEAGVPFVWLPDVRGEEATAEFTNTFPPLQNTGSTWSWTGVGLAGGLLALGIMVLAGVLIRRRREA